MIKTQIITLFLMFIFLSSTITVANAFSVNELKKIPKWDKGISCSYFHILYAHINFVLPSPPLNSE